MMAHGVHDGALLIHHIIVIQYMLAPDVIPLLHTLLGALNNLIHEAVLHGFTLLHAESIHDLGHALAAAEVAHEVVFEGEKELGGAGIALSRTATAKLSVNSASFVAFRPQNEKTSQISHPFAQFDIGTATRHVGGYGYGGALSGKGNDFSLALVIFCVEHLMWYFRHFEHTRQRL